MSMQKVTAAVEDGCAEGRLLLPEGSGACSLVVFHPDAGGIRDAMLEMAGHLTRAGYAVLMVDPYWRHGAYAPFDARTVFGDPPERARLQAMIATVRPDRVIADTDALIAAIDAPRVPRDRYGVVGYCMGGRVAFVTATRRTQVAACAAIHAGGLVTDAPESPHHGVGGIEGALYLGVADQDPSCTPEHQAALESALDAAHVRYQLERYPGARHGFAVPDFPVYDEDAATRHRERVLALFGEHLPSRCAP